jgi:hypothetical protein
MPINRVFPFSAEAKILSILNIFWKKIQVLGFDTDQDETDRLNFCPVNKT